MYPTSKVLTFRITKRGGSNFKGKKASLDLRRLALLQLACALPLDVESKSAPQG